LEPEALTVSGSIGVDSVDIKVTGNLSVSTYSNMEFTEIIGGELSEEALTLDGPGLIIRRPSSSETLWDIAKAYRTTTQAIMEANGLEGELISDQMLLIPR
jgi:LysM repeat protein